MVGTNVATKPCPFPPYTTSFIFYVCDGGLMMKKCAGSSAQRVAFATGSGQCRPESRRETFKHCYYTLTFVPNCCQISNLRRPKGIFVNSQVFSEDPCLLPCFMIDCLPALTMLSVLSQLPACCRSLFRHTCTETLHS